MSAAAVYEASRLSALSSTDVWWHLRTGLWILQNHTLPRTGLFSQHPDLPWSASSWAYDVLLGTAHGVLGLRAIPMLLMTFKGAVAWITFHLASVGRRNFWTAVALTAVAQYLMRGVQPPAVLSIALFGAELLLLVHCRRSGDPRILFWLPPLFLLWANVHIQFVAGLLLLGLFLLALGIEQALRSAGVGWLSNRIRPIPFSKAGAVAALSVLCSLATPYSFRLFPQYGRSLYSAVSFHYGAEMRAMTFRQPEDFALMLLVMGAFFVLGRRRSLEVFELMALVAATALAFRIQRDIWFAVLPCVVVVGDGPLWRGGEENEENRRGWPEALALALTMWVFVAAAACLPGQNALLTRMSREFPLKACGFIVKNRPPQPLFNEYTWGGFLTWYLPDYPVAIDSRVDLYGDEILDEYFKVTTAKLRLDANPDLASARTLLLDRQSGMAIALIKLPALSSQYQLVYSDDLAAVFVRQ